MKSIFGTDGIRGRFNKEITYSLAYKVGYNLGLILEKKNPILIGRDTRISGEILLQGISKGINASGKKCINLGICPTPAIPFLIKKDYFVKLMNNREDLEIKLQKVTLAIQEVVEDVYKTEQEKKKIIGKLIDFKEAIISKGIELHIELEAA